MPRATAVIGANYGDEGKGHIVDFLVSGLSGDKVVVRTNGGAQAGHTVLTPAGQRHVFSHFGSGSLAGASTYLAKHFVLNPLLFWKEAQELMDAHGVGPVVAADPRCFVSTPYDILINQALEDNRGTARHGSVGVGFGETIERNNFPTFGILRQDLHDKDKVANKLRLIRKTWVPARCEQLGIPVPKHPDAFKDALLDQTVDAFCAFDRVVHTAGAEFLQGKQVVFEGAQGLALDMLSPNFPHVTRSRTGIANIIPLAQAAGLPFDVVYVTRTYLTRHGAGPLPGECPPTPLMVDDTNQPHPYQGTLRFAPLDVHAMLERIWQDVRQLPAARWSLALTCIDQVNPNTIVDVLNQTKGRLGFSSTGPGREDVSVRGPA